MGRPATLNIDTPGGEFIVRPYQSGDEHGILELFRTVFGAERSPARWKWAYEDNPAGRHFIMLAVAPDGSLAAQYAGTPYRAVWRGRPVLVNHLIDSMTHPAYRALMLGRRGLFVQLTEHYLNRMAEEHGVAVQYGFPGTRHRRLGNLLLGYHNIKPVLMAATPLPAPQPRQRAPAIPRIWSVRELSFRDVEDLAGLADRAARRYPFMVLRDSAFLRWRYEAHPEQSYRLFALSSWGRVRGMAVLSLQDATVRIVDYLLPENVRLAASFIAELFRIGAGMGGTRIEAWCDPLCPDGKAFEAAGCTVEPDSRDLVLVARSFRNDLDIETEARGFRFTMGDSDLY